MQMKLKNKDTNWRELKHKCDIESFSHNSDVLIASELQITAVNKETHINCFSLINHFTIPEFCFPKEKTWSFTQGKSLTLTHVIAGPAMILQSGGQTNKTNLKYKKADIDHH